jgi:hypothetical protein
MKKVILILIATLSLTFGSFAQNKDSGVPSVNNPALFGGKGFGSAFMGFLRSSNFDYAVRFTSKESIEKYGEDKIREFYKSEKFNFNLKQASMSSDGKYVNIRSTTYEFGTGKFKDFKISIENGECKLVLPDNLKDFLK